MKTNKQTNFKDFRQHQCFLSPNSYLPTHFDSVQVRAMDSTIRHYIQLLEDEIISQEDFDEILEMLRERSARAAPIWRRNLHGCFNLDELSEEDVQNDFRFRREHIYDLMDLLNIPEGVEVPTSFDFDVDGQPVKRYRIPGVTALCVMLRRLAYPNRLYDLQKPFGMAVSTLSTTANFMTNHVVTLKGSLLNDLSTLRWLTPERLESYALAVARKGTALKNCIGFIDGTIRKICRPTVNQELYYNGHKRVHCVKYQSVITPDGIIVSMPGPYKGRMHDAAMWRESGLADQLRPILRTPRQNYVIYGDPAYPISDILIRPYSTSSTNPNAEAFNKSMSKVRQSVEWGFGKIVRYWPFVDFHKNQKLLLQHIGNHYKAATLLTNCHTTLYSSQMSDYFGLNPPTLEQYLTSVN